ncbi:hypothetical protein SO802_029638 [Lithocarpus litseifolius]|uniref:Reverse transcriptase zinc-binding domain-containing protein n=1 Tax=Lithocarpus litseifolius TaxID=425828 RepID=A0AAW2BX07_9ROSI
MAREQSLVWNKIWSLNVPPKVRTFLWRACSNCLPTRDNLHRRRVDVEPHCEICHHRAETVSHILWECPLARNVWAIFKGKAQKCSNTATDFFILFHQMQLKMDQHELESWAVTTWAIWNARNRLYFEHFQTHPKGEKSISATNPTGTHQGGQLDSGPSTPLPDKKLLLFILDRLQKFLLSQFQHFKVIHVYREANRVADKLAKEGCSCPFDFVILDCPNSKELCNILCSNASGLYTLSRNATTLSGLKHLETRSSRKLYQYLLGEEILKIPLPRTGEGQDKILWSLYSEKSL